MISGHVHWGSFPSRFLCSSSVAYEGSVLRRRHPSTQILRAILQPKSLPLGQIPQAQELGSLLPQVAGSHWLVLASRTGEVTQLWWAQPWLLPRENLPCSREHPRLHPGAPLSSSKQARLAQEGQESSIH